MLKAEIFLPTEHNLLCLHIECCISYFIFGYKEKLHEIGGSIHDGWSAGNIYQD